MSIFSFFKGNRNQLPDLGYLTTDIHSHLIPGVDDGIQSIEEGLEILREMRALGYKKIITSPHTMWGTYNNTPDSIRSGLSKMKAAIEKEGIGIDLEAASEYYLDEHFLDLINSGEELLTFGKKHILLETGSHECVYNGVKSSNCPRRTGPQRETDQ